MILIGEKLNSSIPSACEAIKARDEKFLLEMAERQQAGGADYLDVNAAMLPDEPESLRWAVQTLLKTTKAGLVIDSTDPAAMAYALEAGAPEKLILNSVTLEKNRFEGVLQIAKRYHAGVVAMPIDERGMPKDAARRVENAERLLGLLKSAGVDESRVYIDIVVETVSANWEAPRQALEAAAALRSAHPDVHLLAGASNVSYGLPKRAYINAAFVTSAVAMGVDALIMDTASDEMRMRTRAAMLVNGQDEYCMDYIGAYRDIFEEK